LCFMVNSVNWLYTRLEVDGEVLDLNRSQYSDFRRELDFRSGEMKREFIWQTQSGKRMIVRFSRLLSMATKELGFQRISVIPMGWSGPITITMGLDFSVLHQMYGENYWNCPRKEHSGQGSAIVGVSKNIGHKLFAGSSVSGAPHKLEHLVDAQFIGQRFTLALKDGAESIIDKRSVIYTKRDPQQPADECWAEGIALMEHTASISYAAALAENR